MKINSKDRGSIIIVVSAVIVFSIALIGLVLSLVSNNKSVEVIDFSNFKEEEVLKWFEDNKVDSESYLIEYEYSETIEEGKLISQSIDPKKTLEKDSVLTLFFSKGYDPKLLVDVIDFTSMKEEEIDKWFKDNKFSDVTYEYLPSLDIKEDYFIKSNITEKKISRDSVILISISVGKESVGVEINVPDFSKSSKKEIDSWAKENNISVKYTNTISKTISKGSVVSQKPKGGEKIKTGDTLSVSISIGKGITVNDLKGSTKSEVIAFARDNNLKYSFENYYSNSVKNDVVISSRPTGTLTEGSTIIAKLSIGKPVVKNYTGKSLSQFQSHINAINANANQSAKLSIKTEEVESDKEKPGTIIEQKVGSTVMNSDKEVNTGTQIYVKVVKEKTINVSSKTNSSLSDFTNYIKGLGLVLGNKSTKYSTTIEKDFIISNDTGNKKLGSAVNYVLSLGSYNPSASSFDNQNESSIKNTINQANNLDAGWSVSFDYEYNNNIDKGVSYGCSISNKNLKCIISNGSYITVDSKIGTTEKEFIDYINSLGLKADKRNSIHSDTVAAGSIVWNQTGNEFKTGNTIVYDLSLGKENLVTVPEYSLQLLSFGSFEESSEKVISTFSEFTNLDILAVDPDNPNQPSGLVVYISVKPGEKLRPDTLITVKIVK
ncbi:MAG: PASTA domain-containing protein [Anaerorhabdus sp.]